MAIERAASETGKAHAVTIETSRTDAAVLSRSTYFEVVPDAGRKTTADPFERAVGELLAGTGLPLEVRAAVRFDREIGTVVGQVEVAKRSVTPARD